MTGASSGGGGALQGVPFFKMTGSGNDFVVFDDQVLPVDLGTAPSLIETLCHRGNGIGADGVVVLGGRGAGDAVRVRYFNRDGSEGALCGNATLCSTALAVTLGFGSPAGMVLATGDGEVAARLDGDRPSIRLRPVRAVQLTVPGIPVGAGERAGFALVGVPHLVLVTPDVEGVDVSRVGPGLRHHPAVGSAGANVNWVQQLPDGRWRYRTYERGVEGETLACGTGAVAVATLLAAWGLVGPSGASPATVPLWTTSGRVLSVTLPTVAEATAGLGASLTGEGRVVYRGVVSSLA
ncbi:MAG: diaminopimelate epimerase [Gemmatimonadetes bacterium]|nr:diaminopimelate epimerase [Gemmatimonadota bacterium]